MNSASAPVQAPSPAAGAAAVKEQPVYISLYQKREKIQVRSVSGYFARWRWAMVWITQAVFYGLPWLPWNGRPALLFDLVARRFYIFDLVLYPQDFIYLTALLIISAYGLFLATAVGGRLWCGYACPQTVYTQIFMWIERRLEGERSARLRLDRGGWDWDKIWRRSGKHAAWLAVALWTGFTFVGYFTPIRTLGTEALAMLGWVAGSTASISGWEAFWVLFYGLATYGNAGFLREQVCKYMCPYARFQGAMFDRDTLVVSYDTQRGEPRGPRLKDVPLQAGTLGACIDCKLCVQVCPTGIDIRNGLQIDCIACTACIDACESVMDKMAYPRGLIRYATERGMSAQGTAAPALWRRVLRPRVLIYGTVLLLIGGAFITSLALRATFKVDVVRDRASLARLVGQGEVENLYRLQLMNATEEPRRYRVDVRGVEGARVVERETLVVDGAQARWFALHVRLSPEGAAAAGAGAHPLKFVLTDADGDDYRTVTEKSTFIVPR